MTFDARGIIAIVEIVIYVPILLIGFALTLKHGFSKKAGWLMLIILSIARIIGGITHVLSEQNPSNITEKTIYGIMEAAGLSPLLVASLGFLGTVTQYSLEQEPLVFRGLRLLGVLGTVALILAIVGGTSAGNPSSASDLSSGTNLRHVGTILYVVVYAGVVLLTAYCFAHRARILRYRRQLLAGVAAALPFLFVRTLYAVLSAYAPSRIRFDAAGNEELVRRRLGEWGFYLVMSVMMEYAAVLIFVVVGLATPLSKDVGPDYDAAAAKRSGWASTGPGSRGRRRRRRGGEVVDVGAVDASDGPFYTSRAYQYE
ncbi:uncharacterized protein BXZ73DRAFT_90761 [Epithele typhae]|uniref:uncharacterized protein n=1 Tax=Epithele typhae TaxID=378194 RepID=UPI00200853BC|nr:uncharacterized protein BXZ73DRAFT_90761 [Epithele typhae]KAH9927511.1 hypothetical protein BXZ73DRAFT_90761 [Epithele typhae]